MTAAARIGGAASLDAAVPTNITTSTTTLVLTGPCTLEALVFNKPVATGVVAIYDGLTAAGTLIGTITMPASPQPMRLEYHASLQTGLCIVTSVAAQDITVMTKP